MDYFSRCLRSIETKLLNSGVFNELPVQNFAPYQSLLNHHLVHSAIISVDKMPYLRFHSDEAAKFYGIPDPDVTSMNLRIYYQRMRIRDYILLVQGQQFFTRRERGEFRSMFDLKDAVGIYHTFQTSFKTVAWDEEGRAAYAVVVGAPIVDLSYFEAYELFNMMNLSPRSLSMVRLLFHGKSNQEIADSFDLSVKSVEKELQPLFRLTGLRSRKELFKKFDQLKLGNYSFAST